MDQDLSEPFLLIEERREERILESEEEKKVDEERKVDNGEGNKIDEEAQKTDEQRQHEVDLEVSRLIDEAILVDVDEDHSFELQIVEEQQSQEPEEQPSEDREVSEKHIEEDIQVDVEGGKQIEEDIIATDEERRAEEERQSEEAIQTEEVVIQAEEVVIQAEEVVTQAEEVVTQAEETVQATEEIHVEEVQVVKEIPVEIQDDMSSDDLKDREHVVEKILDKKIDDGTVYYLVKWEGYPSSQNTWEPLENLVGCEETMRKFEEIRAHRLALRYGDSEGNPNTKKRTVSRHKEYMLDRILGLTRIKDERYFLISLKGYGQTTFVRASLANKMFPDKVIAFYLKHMQWKKN